MLEEKLAQLGITKNQASVYLALFELGKTRAGKIIEHTGMHRNLVYTALEDLIRRDLVSKIERNGVALFEANSPGSLVALIEKQKEIADEVAIELQQKQSVAPRDIKVYEGVEGVMESRAQTLKLPANETVYVIGGSSLSSRPAWEKKWLAYHKKRIQKKVNLKILIDHSASDTVLDVRNAMPRTEAKRLPFSANMPAFFEAYGDTMTVAVDMENPVAISIRSKSAADSIKNFFNFFWNQDDAPVYFGEAEMVKAYEELMRKISKNDEVVIFAARPGNERVAQSNIELIQRMKAQTKRVRMLYYGRDQVTLQRAGEMNSYGAEVRLLVTDQTLPISTVVAGTITLNSVWGVQPKLFMIKDATVADSLRNNFELLWKQAVSI